MVFSRSSCQNIGTQSKHKFVICSLFSKEDHRYIDFLKKDQHTNMGSIIFMVKITYVILVTNNDKCKLPTLSSTVG